MKKTKESSKELWTHAKQTLNEEKLDKESAKLGVRDQINRTFCKKLFEFNAEKIDLLENEQELPDHMDQEIPQDIMDMEENEFSRMFNPFLELKGSYFTFFIKYLFLTLSALFPFFLRF
jgi:hypothetical protein